MRPARAGLAALLAAGFVLAGCDRGPQLAEPAPQPAPAPAHTAAAIAADAAAAAPGRRYVAGQIDPGEALPDDIARGLATDARVLDCADGVVDGQSAFESGWVVAHPLDLDGDGRDDWLVEGRHRCLAGNDGADWWVYAGEDGGHRLLTAAARARALELLPVGDGFSDLRLQRDAAGDMLLRYEGTAYVPAPAAGD
ncbi:hypothetical protein [Luteimonas arsenica]|uniref:hypothetical protein n=1 Tax=Luteimonas arsenica TaxID=1586242 RepID=UPI0010546BD5|nr:hypothetical protein [Luteimonas arsenica]